MRVKSYSGGVVIQRLEVRTLLHCDLVTNGPTAVSVDDAELRDYITDNEGLTQHAFKASNRRPTIGVGFDLKRRGAKALLQSVGLDQKQLLREAKTPANEASVSTDQAISLFNGDLAIAIDGARTAIPTFDMLSHRQQVAIVDMVFDVGLKQFNGLKKTARAINDGDWSLAAAELAKSKYAKKNVTAERLECNAELLQSPNVVGQPGSTPAPQPEPTPSPSPSPSPTPTPTPAPLDSLTIEPANAASHAVRVGAGRVTLPNGSAIDIAGGVVELDVPEIAPHVRTVSAPVNWAGQADNVRWPDWSANLVPTADTLVLGGLYHSVIPESVIVKNSAGRVMVRNVDYKLNPEWGQVLNLNSRLGEPETGQISISYDAVKQRLDLIQVLPDGSIAVKKGTTAQLCPVLPEPDAGAAALAGVYVYTLDGAKDSGFTIQSRDIYPIQPADPVLPINPDAIPNTLAKLNAGGSVNIAFFGDSITDGAEAGKWWQDRSKTYTSLVAEGLRARFPDADITDTLASQGGRGAIDSQNVFQSRVLGPHNAGSRVDLVVIAMGMNDKGKPSLDPFKSAMTDYIELARAAGIEVLLVTPMQSNPYYEPNQTDRVPRSQIAAAIFDVAAATDAACVDVYTEWVNQATHGVAPISQLHNMFNHPGVAGMRVYADAILRAFPAD